MGLERREDGIGKERRWNWKNRLNGRMVEGHNRVKKIVIIIMKGSLCVLCSVLCALCSVSISWLRDSRIGLQESRHTDRQ
jgi:hypothetical protein